MSMKEKVMQFLKANFKGVVYIFSLVVITAVTITGCVTNGKVKLADRELLVGVFERVDFIADFQMSSLINTINKQVYKINNDPGDIKDDDIKLIMSYWKRIPEEFKTDDVLSAYEMIKEYNDNVILRKKR